MDAPSILATNQTQPSSFNVIDTRNLCTVVAKFKTRTLANRFADKRNNAFGEHRFSVKTVWPA